MKLKEALDASTVGAASFPNVEDIIHCRDGTTWWWLQTRYILRDKPLSEGLRQADGWNPIKPIRPLIRPLIKEKTDVSS